LRSEFCLAPKPPFDGSINARDGDDAQAVGNRELREAVERAAVLASGAPAVTLRHLPRAIAAAARSAPAADDEHPLTSLEEMEREHIARVLAETGSLEKAAATLGIHLTTLWRKRRRYNLT
jgi:NtrC-family two-component system response regulator AlgB